MSGGGDGSLGCEVAEGSRPLRLVMCYCELRICCLRSAEADNLAVMNKKLTLNQNLLGSTVVKGG